jgi:hypothetical protein
MDPVCSKCGMVLCRQHRDKNGIFQQHYTCFPCCRPVEQRVPWKAQQAARRKAEALERRRAQLREEHFNGIGDEALPVRSAGAVLARPDADAEDLLPVKVAGPRPPELRREDVVNPSEKVRSWAEQLATPSPGCSPGAGREPSRAANLGSNQNGVGDENLPVRATSLGAVGAPYAIGGPTASAARCGGDNDEFVDVPVAPPSATQNPPRDVREGPTAAGGRTFVFTRAR